MNEFDKAELLRARANVSFEEARDALKACGGDLMDALVYLEKLGHMKSQEELRKAGILSGCESTCGSTYGSTSGSTTGSRIGSTTGNYSGAAEKKEPSFLSWLGHALGSLVKKSMENFLVVSHEGVVKFRISIFALALLFLFLHGALLVGMVVSLFFGVKYSFAGKNDLSNVNRVMSQAGDRASEWWGRHRYNPEVEALCRKYDAQDIK